MTKPSFDREAVLKTARRLHADQIKWRRTIHQHPEVANEEFQTTEFIRKQCRRLGLKLLPIKMKTGVLAELSGTKAGSTVVIRTDIDALPVQEQTGLPFASKIPGRMHACGHDVHTAVVLGTAALLAQLKDQVHGTVRFIFQPAEEEPPGGAQPMIANGALKGAGVVFGLHVDSAIPVGKVGFCDGPMMASVYDFDLTIKGRGGHAARPHLSVDAIATAAQVIEALQKVVSRETDPMAPTVLTFGRIEGGAVRNVIADRVRLWGTARALAQHEAKLLPKLIRRTIAGVCKTRGASFELEAIAGYPVLNNDPAVNRLQREVCRELFGARSVAEAPPTLGGEDFAFYVSQVPGAMFRLGIGNKKIGADKPWHSPKFIVDEEAIFYATALLAGSTLSYLG